MQRIRRFTALLPQPSACRLRAMARAPSHPTGARGRDDIPLRLSVASPCAASIWFSAAASRRRAVRRGKSGSGLGNTGHRLPVAPLRRRAALDRHGVDVEWLAQIALGLDVRGPAPRQGNPLRSKFVPIQGGGSLGQRVSGRASRPAFARSKRADPERCEAGARRNAAHRRVRAASVRCHHPPPSAWNNAAVSENRAACACTRARRACW